MKAHTEPKAFLPGLLLISAGIILNEWFLSSLMSHDGIIADTHRKVIWIFDIGAIITGLLLIIFRKSLTREKLIMIGGMLFIAAGIIFIEKVLPVLTDTPMNDQNRVLLRGSEVYVIITGIMTVLYRKSLDMRIISLFFLSSLICFLLFIGYDYYRSYSLMRMIRAHNSAQGADVVQAHLFVRDSRLGWDLIPGSTVRHTEKGKFDALYEIDENGYRKINNTAANPDLSIYFFGDSFVFGHGVNNEETFPSIIKDAYLRENVNVYNAGVMGYGIVQMFQRFQNMKHKIRPGDLIIFAPISEDIRRNLRDFQFPYFIKFTNIMKVDEFPFFDNGVITYHKMEDSILNKLKVVAMNAQYTGEYFRSVRRKFIPDTIRDAQEMIRLAAEETELKGGRFALFFLPRMDECISRSYVVDISGFDYLDLMQFFPSEESELNRLIISRKDAHWNILGHETAARGIMKTLVQNGIIEGKYVRGNLYDQKN